MENIPNWISRYIMRIIISRYSIGIGIEPMEQKREPELCIYVNLKYNTSEFSDHYGKKCIVNK